MDRKNLIERFVNLAGRIGDVDLRVGKAILAIVQGEENVPHTWLVRWNHKGYEWEGNSKTPERVIGYAWVLAGCGDWQRKLPMIIPERGRYQAIWVNQIAPLNHKDVEDAAQARKLGIEVHVEPQYPAPDPALVTNQEGFEAVVRIARPVWVDDSRRGRVVIGHESGCDNDRPCESPVYGAAVEYGPGFRVDGVPPDWVGDYSRLTAYSADGATKFEASFSNGGGGPAKMAEISDDKDVVWRIPRHFVEQLLGLTEEAFQLQKDEEVARAADAEAAERKRLIEKFSPQS